MTLWQLIDNAIQQIPFTRAKLESSLGTQLAPSDNSSNDAFELWMGGHAKLQDGVEIGNVDLRVKKVGPHPGFLVLGLAGNCVTLSEVRSHYPDMKMTESPRGRSLDDTTAYTSQLAWGSLSFSFSERKPECVSSIAFDPRR